MVKNGDERLVVCNETARSVIEELRGKHPTHVFSFKGRPLARMLSTGWRQARVKAKLPEVRVHDLKHTFGRRLRAAGVSFEDRQDLLGHRSGELQLTILQLSYKVYIKLPIKFVRIEKAA